MSLVSKAVGAAFSVGPGYEPQPLGGFEPEGVGAYFLDLRAKTKAASARMPSSLGAAALAQLALGWWDRGESARAWFLVTADALADRAERRADGWRWRYEVAVPKYGLRPGWCSAMAQGQAASVFVRAHLVTGRDDYAQAALAALQPLHRATDGLVTSTSAGPVLEEAPSAQPSHILNGWIYALWGVRDVHQGLGDHGARVLFEESAACLESMLPRYDTGWWTRYGLYPELDLAKPFYHRIHALQLDAMSRLTGSSRYAEYAERWHGYDTPVNRARIVARKGVALARAA
ncbi:MAG: hypothetical protein QOE36_1613 [Gaiellaceae bacterium]|nr:hypothetical protein [Gaiellaceae bacterium]